MQQNLTTPPTLQIVLGCVIFCTVEITVGNALLTDCRKSLIVVNQASLVSFSVISRIFADH
jgi:hypothetical protein